MAQSQQFEDVPFVILAVGPFAPAAGEGASLRRIQVDRTTLDDAFAAFAPTLRIEVPKAYCPDAWVTVAPRSLRDLRPENLATTSPYLLELHEARTLLQEARTSGPPPQQVASSLRSKCPNLPLDYAALDADGTGGGAAGGDDSAVDDILSMVASSSSSGSGSSGGKGIAGLLAQVEGLMAGVLQAVYDSPEFRTFESAWRGVELVLKQADIKEGSGIHLELASLNTTENGWIDTLEGMVDDLAGELPNLVVADAWLDSAPQRIETARRLAGFADTLLTPTLVGIGAQFFRLQDWSELGKVPYIKNFLEDAGFAKWRNLRKESGAGWLCPALNGVLARPRIGQDAPPRSVFFSETAPLWLNPAWGVAALVAKCVSVHGWPSRLTDYHSVALENLPVADGNDGPMATQMRLGEGRIAEFVEAGFTPVIGAVHKDIAITPRAVTLSGDSLAPQLFLNRVLGFLFWCRDNLAGQIDAPDPAEVADNLKFAFSLFWQRTGHQPPADLHITPGEHDEGALPLAIGFTPPKDVLPGGAKVEFTFGW